MNLGQALWRLGEIIAMLKRFKITAALTKAGVEFIDGHGSDGVPAGQEGRRGLHPAPTNSRYDPSGEAEDWRAHL